jgi:hypothetical protein
MKIYANGCSFTYGDELINPAADAWPTLLANKLHSSVVNDAISGGTNYRTLYRTIKNIKEDYDLCLIAWTDYSRFTVYKSDDNFEINFNTNLKHTMYQNTDEFKKWGLTFYKHWYNELYAFKLWLQQIMQLQSLLKNKNYVMINTMPNNLSNWTADKDQFIKSVKNLINIDSMNDKQIFDEYDEINYYIDSIDLSKFYQWNAFYITQLCSDFPIGVDGHILEQGHQHLAKLLYDHICLK